MVTLIDPSPASAAVIVRLLGSGPGVALDFARLITQVPRNGSPWAKTQGVSSNSPASRTKKERRLVMFSSERYAKPGKDTKLRDEMQRDANPRLKGTSSLLRDDFRRRAETAPLSRTERAVGFPGKYRTSSIGERRLPPIVALQVTSVARFGPEAHQLMFFPTASVARSGKGDVIVHVT